MEHNGRRVRLVAGLHGNEQAPVKALRDTGAEFLLGNPDAYAKQVRYLDTDLNASFGLEGESLEIIRAQELLKLIAPEEVVIDFHATSAVTESFAILVSESMLPLATRTGLTKVVLMTHNIKDGHALINHRDGISVEISGYDTPESYVETLRVLGHLRSDKSADLTVYEVYDRITQPGEYQNFVEHHEGFVPVLVGEKSYDFIGLKARIR